NADELLLLGDDAGFDARGARITRHQAETTNVLLLQQTLQLICGGIATDRAKNLRRNLERGKIARHVRGAARHETLSREVHHRYRRFWRNAGHAAPDEMVQHQVADHQHADARCGRKNFANAGLGDGLAHVRTENKTPNSIASAAWLGAPKPASTTTGTVACSMMMRIWSRVCRPRLEPMGEPSGITVAAPTSWSRFASTGSALMYGSTVKPSFTSNSAALSVSTGSGSK